MIGEHIKKIREGKNMSINQLALYSDVSAAHISRIERGLRDPSPDILKKISEALKVPYEELMVQAGYLGWDSERPREESTGATDLEELLKQDTLMFDGEPYHIICTIPISDYRHNT